MKIASRTFQDSIYFLYTEPGCCLNPACGLFFGNVQLLQRDCWQFLLCVP